MNAHFPRIISLLRREKHLSQKQAAADLGISQALLSHYEKGIRECGLDFIVRAANYYSVSCDYLLGRSPDRSGMTLSVEDLPEPDSAGKETATGSAGLLPMLNKKLIANSLNILFDLLAKTRSRALVQECSAFLMLAVYRVFRVVYSCESHNSQALFSAPKGLYDGYADASMHLASANASAIARGENGGPVTPLPLTSESLSESYPLFAASLFNLIKNAEDQMPLVKKEK